MGTQSPGCGFMPSTPADAATGLLAPGDFEKLGVVLDVGPAGAPNAVAADGACVVARKDRFRLWYTASNGRSSGVWCVESADALDWAGPRMPVLGEGPSGATARDPFAFFHQGLWYLWYSAGSCAELDPAHRASIWCSISSDADHWLGHTVALEPGATFERVAVVEPAVARDPVRNLWLMAYAASDGTTWRIGLAESNDLMRWKRLGMAMEAWTGQVGGCRTPRLFRLGDRWLLVFTVEIEGRAAVYRSTSPDGVWWLTPQPLLDPGLATERDGQRAGCPVQVGEDLYVYYGGLAEGRWRTHAAVIRGFSSPAA